MQTKKSIKLQNDLFYVCTVIERTARKIKRHNKYVVNKIGEKELENLLRFADIYHSENQDEICDNLVKEYRLRKGEFDIINVNEQLCQNVPTINEISKVYERLIWSTTMKGEQISKSVMRIYNNKICRIIDDYNGCAYYAPSAALVQAYTVGYFD